MRPVLLFCVAFVLACGGDDNTSGIPDACNPLGGQGCLKPWPSVTYLRADPSSSTGFRVDLPPAGMPVNVDGVAVEPTALNRLDGFSLSGPILASFPEGVSPIGLPSALDIDASLAPGAAVVLLDLERGERVPLFAEVDVNTTDVGKRDLILRPLARLRPGARYVAAIRKAVRAADGGEIASPPAFRALLDGTGFPHPRFAALRARWPVLRDALAVAGIPEDDLVLAWELVTASNESMRRDLTSMRSQALPAIGTAGASLSFAVTSTEPNVATTYRRYLGTYTSPDFLTDGEADVSLLRRDPDGTPAMLGRRDARFSAIVPSCVTSQPLPRPTVIFGHGLFGSSEGYLSDSFVLELANRLCFVVVAGDFIGLTSRQIPLAPLAVNDMNRGTQISEKLAQSVIDFIALEHVVRGPMAGSAEFAVGGQPVIDPTEVFYVGGSLGGTMGNVVMAYDPHLAKGVLAVPGGVWSMLFERSTAWYFLLGAAQGSYEDPSLYQLVVAILGLALEPYDPITTAAHVIRDPMFPGQPEKQILMWYAVGDSLVTNIATELVAREMKIPMLAPSVRAPWGLSVNAGPLRDAIVLYDEHRMPVPPGTNQPPKEDNGTHGGVNDNGAVFRQVEEFLVRDQVIATCKSGDVVVACDCDPGGGGVCD